MVESATPKIVTFGCRLNVYESEVIRKLAQEAEAQNAIIFNTCAVTEEAERQARQAIRKARRENPKAWIIVTGCAAQINPHSFSKMEEVNQVLGNEEKLHLKNYKLSKPFEREEEKIIVNDIMSVKETALHLISGFENHVRAFIQVQNGCNHRCTFCRIPYGRGNSRSVAMGDITAQIRALVENGYQEVVLTGVDITSYGGDLPGQPTLGQIIRRLLALVPTLPRLRLSSLDPMEIDADLMDLILYEPRLMPHLHLSLQAGDNMILKRMKRRHLREDVIQLCEKIRYKRSDVAFGADIIAGFPTETEEMFANSLKIVEECDLTFLHVFPYSAHQGTPAARMPQVAPSLIKERALQLRQAGEKQQIRFLKKQIGTMAHVLVEPNHQGRAENFSPVKFSSTMSSDSFNLLNSLNTVLKPGRIVKTRLTSFQEGSLIGELLEEASHNYIGERNV